MTGERSFDPPDPSPNPDEVPVTAMVGEDWTRLRDTLLWLIAMVEPQTRRLGVGIEEVQMRHDALDATFQREFGEHQG